jgi:hypothetical protein
VQVADFAPAHSKEDDSATMSFHYNVWPGRYFILDSGCDCVRH